jgi:hypothetical protein
MKRAHGVADSVTVGLAEEDFMAVGTVAKKAPAWALVKYLPVVEAARYIPIQAGARVHSSSRPIAASATPGPFSKVASIANPRVPGGPAPAVGAPQGGLFRGAAGGAALGAIGGAIGGNAGKGAAIGAGTGAVFGGMRRRRWAEREEFQQTSYLEQQQSALNQGRGNFNQAFGVCMTGRGYTVG